MITDQYSDIITGERCKEYQLYYDALMLKKYNEVDLFWKHIETGKIENLFKREDLDELVDIILDYNPETVNTANVETGKSHFWDTLCKYPNRMTNLKLKPEVFDLPNEELHDCCEFVIADLFCQIRGIKKEFLDELYVENINTSREDLYDELASKYLQSVLIGNNGLKDYILSGFMSEDPIKEKEKIQARYIGINTFPQMTWSISDEAKDLSTLFSSGNIYNPKTKRFGFGNAGLTTLEYYFPNLNDVFKAGIKHSMRTAFYDDYHLFTILRKAMKYGTNNSRTFYRWLRISGVGYCTNFKPQVSKSLYEYFGKPENCKVYDFAAGYAGRLLGAYAAHNVSEYIGVDVNTETVNYHQVLIKNLEEKYPMNNKSVKTILCGSEEFIQKNPQYINYFDIAFSSPQYFNTEIYSKEETQSCHKFNQYSSWVNNFYNVTILNALDSLKIDGVFGMNIFEKMPALKTLCKEVCLLKGFILYEDALMVFRTMPGAVGKGKKRDLNVMSNGEPIWFFIHIDEALNRGIITVEQHSKYKLAIKKKRELNKSILEKQYPNNNEPKQHIETIYE